MKHPRSCIIYGLVDPNTLELRYIGKSVTGLNRAKFHKYGKRRRTHKERWIGKLLDAGQYPDAVVLDEVISISALDDAERFWIAMLRALGARLTNATAGGDGQAYGDRNPMHSAAARAKFSAANKGRRFTPEHKANWLASQRTVEISALRAERARKRWQDPEYRAAQSARMKAENAKRWADPEFRARAAANIAIANKSRR